MSPLPKIAKKSSHKASSGWPLVVVLWMAGLGFTGYVIGRIALYAYPHPVHWGSGLLGVVVGCGVGWLWYRTKGDVV